MLNVLATLACAWVYGQAPLLATTVGLGLLAMISIGWLSALVNFLGLARRELAPVVLTSGVRAGD